jgi:TfoX/Sxy family transcriptional regulator of competence genes
MVAIHLAALRSLLERAAPARGRTRDIEIQCKHFFSGAAAYASGRIFMTLTSVGLALKLPAKAQALLVAQGGKPLRYFPTGPIKKDYVVVPGRIAANPSLLAPWIAKSIRFSQVSREAPRAKARRGRSAN